jgi:phosphoenolpyruvate carboxykinase (GTP)
MGKKMSNPPKIFHVNWFRTNEKGEFIWPGFGDNFRVIEWMLKRCENKVDANATSIGYMPKPEDINIEGLELSTDTLSSLLTINNESWLEDVNSIKEFYAKIGDTIPDELYEELKILTDNLNGSLSDNLA